VSIHPDTSIGAVRLTVSDLGRSRDFYERVIGLSVAERDDGTIALGVHDAGPLLVLTGDPSAPRVNHRLTGLFHLAILMPSRLELARALLRLGHGRWPLSGASDHLVSEAVYLSDPDGNGIEIYRDRPRDDWPHQGPNLQMATLPLDLDDVLAEVGGTGPGESFERAPAGTTMGHVHLQVAELEPTEAFYAGALGFDVTVRGYPGALFLSAGGYHHHLGANTWHSAGSPPPPPGSVGLRAFEVVLPSDDELQRILEQARAAGISPEQDNGGALLRDPSGNSVLLTAR
jgi:catechol 2,3-dioxygenase